MAAITRCTTGEEFTRCTTGEEFRIFDRRFLAIGISKGDSIMWQGHLFKHMGYVERTYFDNCPKSKIHERPDENFCYGLGIHRDTEDQFTTQDVSLSSSSKSKSDRSLWLSAAVVIGTLFAIAMVARFGSGMGMSTSSAKIFAGVTGAALATYTLCALPLGLLIHRREHRMINLRTAYP